MIYSLCEDDTEYSLDYANNISAVIQFRNQQRDKLRLIPWKDRDFDPIRRNGIVFRQEIPDMYKGLYAEIINKIIQEKESKGSSKIDVIFNTLVKDVSKNTEEDHRRWQINIASHPECIYPMMLKPCLHSAMGQEKREDSINNIDSKNPAEEIKKVCDGFFNKHDKLSNQEIKDESIKKDASNILDETLINDIAVYLTSLSGNNKDESEGNYIGALKTYFENNKHSRLEKLTIPESRINNKDYRVLDIDYIRRDKQIKIQEGYCSIMKEILNTRSNIGKEKKIEKKSFCQLINKKGDRFVTISSSSQDLLKPYNFDVIKKINVDGLGYSDDYEFKYYIQECTNLLEYRKIIEAKGLMNRKILEEIKDKKKETLGDYEDQSDEDNIVDESSYTPSTSLANIAIHAIPSTFSCDKPVSNIDKFELEKLKETIEDFLQKLTGHTSLSNKQNVVITEIKNVCKKFKNDFKQKDDFNKQSDLLINSYSLLINNFDEFKNYHYEDYYSESWLSPYYLEFENHKKLSDINPYVKISLDQRYSLLKEKYDDTFESSYFSRDWNEGFIKSFLEKLEVSKDKEISEYIGNKDAEIALVNLKQIILSQNDLNQDNSCHRMYQKHMIWVNLSIMLELARACTILSRNQDLTSDEQGHLVEIKKKVNAQINELEDLFLTYCSDMYVVLNKKSYLRKFFKEHFAKMRDKKTFEEYLENEVFLKTEQEMIEFNRLIVEEKKRYDEKIWVLNNNGQYEAVSIQDLLPVSEENIKSKKLEDNNIEYNDYFWDIEKKPAHKLSQELAKMEVANEHVTEELNFNKESILEEIFEQQLSDRLFCELKPYYNSIDSESNELRNEYTRLTRDKKRNFLDYLLFEFKNNENLNDYEKLTLLELIKKHGNILDFNRYKRSIWGIKNYFSNIQTRLYVWKNFQNARCNYEKNIQLLGELKRDLNSNMQDEISLWMQETMSRFYTAIMNDEYDFAVDILKNIEKKNIQINALVNYLKHEQTEYIVTISFKDMYRRENSNDCYKDLKLNLYNNMKDFKEEIRSHLCDVYNKIKNNTEKNKFLATYYDRLRSPLYNYFGIGLKYVWIEDKIKLDAIRSIEEDISDSIQYALTSLNIHAAKSGLTFFDSSGRSYKKIIENQNAENKEKKELITSNFTTLHNDIDKNFLQKYENYVIHDCRLEAPLKNVFSFFSILRNYLSAIRQEDPCYTSYLKHIKKSVSKICSVRIDEKASTVEEYFDNAYKQLVNEKSYHECMLFVYAIVLVIKNIRDFAKTCSEEEVDKSLSNDFLDVFMHCCHRYIAANNKLMTEDLKYNIEKKNLRESILLPTLELQSHDPLEVQRLSFNVESLKERILILGSFKKAFKISNSAGYWDDTTNIKAFSEKLKKINVDGYPRMEEKSKNKKGSFENIDTLTSEIEHDTWMKNFIKALKNFLKFSTIGGLGAFFIYCSMQYFELLENK